MKRLWIVFILLCFGSVPLVAQELKGPTQIVPGTLAVFEISPPQIASWIVTPSDSGNTTFAVDSASARMYFATSNKGTYTIVAAIINDERPHQLTATLINDSGEPDPPEPGPTPVPNTGLAQWLAKEIPALVKSKNIEAEKVLIAGCFKRISESIDQGVIQTAGNARTQLQISLTGALAKASQTAVTDWQEFLVALSKKMEEQLGDKIDSIQDVKKLFLELSTLFTASLSSVTEQQSEEQQSEQSRQSETTLSSPSVQPAQESVVPQTTSGSAESNTPCANGQCPVPGTIYRFIKQ